MNSYPTENFWKRYRSLPEEVRQAARKAYRLWKDNPQHPSIHFKKLQGTGNLYSVRIGIYYRAIGWVEQDAIYWGWIGPHSEYDKIIGNT